jgi:Inner membrane component of T3SS, cytoplasmic domain/Protein of unknown function (DUF3662)
VLLRFEAWCSDVVERAFARAFPGPLEPVQIARRLIATIERDPPQADEERITRYVVRIGAADYARLGADRAFLEAQWTRMAAILAERSGRRLAGGPLVALREDRSLVTGTVAVDVGVTAPLRPEPTAPAALALRVAHGLARATIALPRAGSDDPPIVIGRDPGCDVVLADRRVSRRHLRVVSAATAIRFEDLGSSNGTLHNGTRTGEGALRAGDRLTLGDTTFAVERRAGS